MYQLDEICQLFGAEQHFRAFSQRTPALPALKPNYMSSETEPKQEIYS